MKKKFLLLLVTSLFTATFSSCSSTPNPTPTPDPTPHPDPTPVEPDLYDGYEITNPEAKRPTSGIEQINIFGINDFHGAINETYKEAGLANIGTFIKQKTALPNTLFIDSGDTWQGSLESNYNEGKLITEVYNNAKISARVSGNHDFDWGVEKFAINVKNSSFPNLAANVYDYTWETKKDGENQQKSLGKSYATYVLDNGLKVGIIGTIGESQITSITTQYVENITFKSQTEIIQNVSDFLRTKKNCDIIISASHSSYDQMLPYQLTKVSDVSNKRYVDLVLNAHTHKNEVFSYDDVKFVQYGANGELIGNVKLYYNFEKNQLVDLSTSTRVYSKTQIKEEINDTIDSEIQEIINKYSEETKELGDQVITTNLSGSFYSSEQLPNLMAEAIYNEAISEGYNVDFAYTNSGRASHYASSMTYSDLYNIFPFDNTVHIIEVTGKDAANMLRFKNNIYRADPTLQIRYEGKYKVACLDYLAYHCDNKRNYDFFPILTKLGKLTKNNEDYKYREIVKDYLLANKDKQFNADDYSFLNPRFAREG